MTKTLIGLFAHPDDEAFGPSGTLLKLRDSGYDIHLILLTHGEAGSNPDGVADLGATRLVEWQAAAKLLGAASTHTGDFPDGALETIPDEQIDKFIEDIVTTIGLTSADIIMTFEPRGLTGHRDHIAATRAAEHLSEHLHTKELWYYCLDESQAPLEAEYYHPHAREASYINLRIDSSPYTAQKHTIMASHRSQRADAETMKTLGNTECFHVASAQIY